MPKKVSRRRFVGGSIRLAVVSQLIQLKPLDAIAQPWARLQTAERRTLRAAADVIIPAQDRMPAASAVGTVAYIERIASQDAKLGALFLEGLRALDAHSGATHAARFDMLMADLQVEVIAHVEKTDSPAGFFLALRDLVYEAYYTQPRVMSLIGYNFRAGRRRSAAVETFDEQQLARVRKMAPLYREIKS